MRRRTETKAELKARADRASSEAWLAAHALHYVLHETPDATASWPEATDTGRYEATLYAATAPHGGIVLVTFHYPGQRPHTAPYYLENWHANVMGNRVLPLEIKVAASDLMRAACSARARLAAERVREAS